MIGILRKHFGLIALAVAVGCAAGCARSPQAKEARFLQDGKARLLKEDYARALLQFRSAVQVAPQDAEAHAHLGLALVESGDVGAAQLRVATEAQISLAQLMLTSGDPQVLAARPANAVALTALDFREWRLGHPDRAEQRFRLALAREPRHLAELEKLYAANQSNREIRGLPVNVYMRTSRYVQAESLLSQALTDRANLRIIMGGEMGGEMGGKLREAQEDMPQGLRFHPDAAPAHHNMAVIYRLRGSGGNERRELNESLRLDPRLLEARIDLAKNLIRDGAPQDALHVLDEPPDDRQRGALQVVEVRNWAWLALLDLASAGQGIEAGLNRARTRDLLPQVLLSTFANPCEAAPKIRGYLVERQAGNLDAAIADLRQAVDAQPRHPLILNNLAYLLADRGGAGEALAPAQKAKELAVAQEASPRHQIHLAMVCARLGDVRRGQQVLNAARKAAPDLPEAQYARQLLAQSSTRRR